MENERVETFIQKVGGWEGSFGCHELVGFKERPIYNLIFFPLAWQFATLVCPLQAMYGHEDLFFIFYYYCFFPFFFFLGGGGGGGRLGSCIMIVTQDELKRKDWPLPSWCYLFKGEEVSTNNMLVLP